MSAQVSDHKQHCWCLTCYMNRVSGESSSCGTCGNSLPDTFSDLGAFSTASVFSWDLCRPCLSVTNPQYEILFLKNISLSSPVGLTYQAWWGACLGFAGDLHHLYLSQLYYIKVALHLWYILKRCHSFPNVWSWANAKPKMIVSVLSLRCVDS